MRAMNKCTVPILLFVFVGSISFADDKPKDKANATVIEGPIKPDKNFATVVKGETTPALRAAEEGNKEVTGEKQEKGLSWWQLLLGKFIELVFTVFGIVCTVFISVALKKYRLQAHTEKIENIVEQSFGYAEQMSKKLLKLQGKPLDSVKKLETAVRFAQELAVDVGIPEKGGDWWEGKIEAWLGVNKAS